MSETMTGETGKTRKRLERVHVRFTTAEYAHVKELAQITNKEPTALLRSVILGERLKAAQRLPDDVYRAVRSLSGNINQLAHQANMGRVDVSAVEALRAEVGQLLKVLLN